ncbi:MAG: hypothetical protein IBX66_11655 [Lutibacter sp.]|nr:hypothetical protein [Lutibacter sp.]
MKEDKKQSEKINAEKKQEIIRNKFLGKIPNYETIKAIKKAQSGKGLKRITNLTTWLEEL